MSERNPADEQDPLHTSSILGPSQSPEESADKLELRAHVHALQHNPLCYRILENALHCLKEPRMDIIQGSCDTCVTAGLCVCRPLVLSIWWRACFHKQAQAHFHLSSYIFKTFIFIFRSPKNVWPSSHLGQECMWWIG